MTMTSGMFLELLNREFWRDLTSDGSGLSENCHSTFKSFTWHPGSEVLTAVAMKSSILWHITPCKAVKINRCSKEIMSLTSFRVLKSKPSKKPV
jgi:hypothetical protein